MSIDNLLEVEINISKGALTREKLGDIIDYPIKMGFTPWDHLLEKFNVGFDEYKMLFIENTFSNRRELTRPVFIRYVFPPIDFTVYCEESAKIVISLDSRYLFEPDANGDKKLIKNANKIGEKIIDFGVHVWNQFGSNAINGVGLCSFLDNFNLQDVGPTFPLEKYTKRETFWLNFIRNNSLFPDKYRDGVFNDSPEFDWYKVIPLTEGKLYISSPLPYSIMREANDK